MNPFTEFIFMKQDKRLHTASFRNRQYSICKKIGFYPKSPHKLRKTYASLLSDYNVDPKMTIEQMGHTNISCTQGHYFRNRKSISTKTAILNSIPELQIAQKITETLSDYSLSNFVLLMFHKPSKYAIFVAASTGIEPVFSP